MNATFTSIIFAFITISLSANASSCPRKFAFMQFWRGNAFLNKAISLGRKDMVKDLPEDVTRFLYRGMRVGGDELDDILKNGMKVARSGYGHLFSSTEPEMAVYYALSPMPPAGSFARHFAFFSRNHWRPRFSVIFQIERDLVHEMYRSGRTGVSVIDQDIPPGAILGAFVFDRKRFVFTPLPR